MTNKPIHYQLSRLACLLGLPFTLLLFGISEAQGQRYSLGGGPTYATNTEVIGLNVRGYYNINEHICFGPEFSYFLPKKESEHGEEIELQLWEANYNIHYIFHTIKHVGLYPVGGINFTQEREKIKRNIDLLETEHVESAWGLNLGGGLHYNTSSFEIFGEYKYVVSTLEDHFLTIGFFYNFGPPIRSNKHHEEQH